MSAYLLGLAIFIFSGTLHVNIGERHALKVDNTQKICSYVFMLVRMTCESSESISSGSCKSENPANWYKPNITSCSPKSN